MILQTSYPSVTIDSRSEKRAMGDGWHKLTLAQPLQSKLPLLMAFQKDSQDRHSYIAYKVGYLPPHIASSVSGRHSGSKARHKSQRQDHNNGIMNHENSHKHLSGQQSLVRFSRRRLNGDLRGTRLRVLTLTSRLESGLSVSSNFLTPPLVPTLLGSMIR